MKIVQLCGWYYPQSLGGTEGYVAALARRFRSARHEVLVAAPDAAQTATERVYLHEGVPVYRYPIAGEPSRAEARHRVAVRGAERLHTWLRRERPDVVHVHTFVTGVGPHEIQAARDAGARVIVTTHAGSLGFLCQRGTLMRWGSRACDGAAGPFTCAGCALQASGLPRPAADVVGAIPPLVGRALGLVPGPVGTALGMTAFIDSNLRQQRSMLDAVDAFVVLTEAARTMVTAQAGGHGRVVLNRLGIDTAAAPPRPMRQAGAPMTVAYLGRFDPIKGVHDLARAVRLLGRSAPIRFEFRGPVTNTADLAIATELKRIVGPDAWVTFGAPLAPADVPAYLASIDLLCCPSRTFEGGPTVALEALAVGTPVLGTRIGGLLEVVHDGVTGALVAPGDWRSLASTLRTLAANRGQLDLWRAAITPVRSMDDVAADYLSLYTSCR